MYQVSRWIYYKKDEYTNKEELVVKWFEKYPKLNQTTILPSINLVYKLKDDDLLPVNARLNFSKSVARPSIRELSDVAVFDYELRSFVFGNSSLKAVDIFNYDFRLESYF